MSNIKAVLIIWRLIRIFMLNTLKNDKHKHSNYSICYEIHKMQVKYSTFTIMPKCKITHICMHAIVCDQKLGCGICFDCNSTSLDCTVEDL